MIRRLSLVALLASIAIGCAALDGLRALIHAPRFEHAADRQSEIRLVRPGANGPAGGASVIIWTRVENPNGFGLTLGTLRGTLLLEGARAATVDFPLGLPLEARGASVIPLDIAVSFEDLPGLGQAITRAVAREPVEYTLEGTIGVTTGRFGDTVFGPMTLVRGELQ